MKKYIISLLFVSFFIFFKLGFVVGNSMKPSLSDNDFILISRFSYPDTNKVIVFEHSDTILVKRIVACSGDFVDNKYVPFNKYYVLGDNLKFSVDSRCFGYIDKSKIKGVVIFHCSFLVFIVILITLISIIGILIYNYVLKEVKSSEKVI